MASKSSSTSPTRIRRSTLHRSPSPNPFCSSSISRSSIFNFLTRPAPVLTRSTTPTTITSSTVRFSTSNHDQKSNTRPLSPNRFCSSSVSISPISDFVTRPAPVLASSTTPVVRFSTSNHRQIDQKSNTRPLSSAPKTCACSPTTHPGSYRCSLHKKNPAPGHVNNQAASSSNYQLNTLRSAMKNPLVRIATGEGDLVNKALESLIRPSSHTQEPRAAFQPRPSRLSIMSKAEE